MEWVWNESQQSVLLGGHGERDAAVRAVLRNPVTKRVEKRAAQDMLRTMIDGVTAKAPIVVGSLEKTPGDFFDRPSFSSRFEKPRIFLRLFLELIEGRVRKQDIHPTQTLTADSRVAMAIDKFRADYPMWCRTDVWLWLGAVDQNEAADQDENGHTLTSPSNPRVFPLPNTTLGSFLVPQMSARAVNSAVPSSGYDTDDSLVGPSPFSDDEDHEDDEYDEYNEDKEKDVEDVTGEYFGSTSFGKQCKGYVDFSLSQEEEDALKKDHPRRSGFGGPGCSRSAIECVHEYPAIFTRPLNPFWSEDPSPNEDVVDTYFPGLFVMPDGKAFMANSHEQEPEKFWVPGYLTMIRCSECTKWQEETAFSYDFGISSRHYSSCNHCLISRCFRSLESASNYFARMWVKEMELVLQNKYAQLDDLWMGIGTDVSECYADAPSFKGLDASSIMSQPFDPVDEDDHGCAWNRKRWVWNRKEWSEKRLPLARDNIKRVRDALAHEKRDCDHNVRVMMDSAEVIMVGYDQREQQLEEFERRHEAGPLWVIKYFISRDRFGRIPSISARLADDDQEAD
ncbi:hypothetical protein QBC35DRAFT_468148 [Podospora australis]|uniref:Uncharacterized protein n=1 Tax=Podospora australis TaxID=1536484 RepID=A0AAN6WLK4_9PEZI|nr:hypothetical protein QBC35DRAFT_468148 [Podospora australis]